MDTLISIGRGLRFYFLYIGPAIWLGSELVQWIRRKCGLVHGGKRGLGEAIWMSIILLFSGPIAWAGMGMLILIMNCFDKWFTAYKQRRATKKFIAECVARAELRRDKLP